MPTFTSLDMVNAYHHTLEHDFRNANGNAAVYAPNHPKKWVECDASIRISVDRGVRALDVSTGGRLIAVVTGLEVRIYDARTLELQQTLMGHVDRVAGVQFHPNGRILVSEGEVVRLWALDDEPQEGQTEGNQSASIDAIAVKLTESAAAELVGHAVWTKEEVADASSQALKEDLRSVLLKAIVRNDIAHNRVFKGKIAHFGSRAFDSSGTHLFYVFERKTVVVVDVYCRTEKFRLVGHTDGIMWVGDSPDGRLIASSSWDRSVKLWDSRTGELVRTLLGSEGQNWAGKFSPDGEMIAVGSGDKTVRVWKVQTGELLHTLIGYSGWIRALDFVHIGGNACLAAGGVNGVMRVYDLTTGSDIQYWQAKPSGADNSVEVHLLKHGLEVAIVQTMGPLLAWNISFDGRIVVYDVHGNIKWEFEQGREDESHKQAVTGYGAFKLFADAEGHAKVISADGDGVVRIWRLDG